MIMIMITTTMQGGHNEWRRGLGHSSSSLLVAIVIIIVENFIIILDVIIARSYCHYHRILDDDYCHDMIIMILATIW